MRSGHICGRKDLILESHGTRLGVNAISTCSTRMATSCRLLGRYNELAKRMCPDEVCVAVTVDQGVTQGIRAGYCCRCEAALDPISQRASLISMNWRRGARSAPPSLRAVKHLWRPARHSPAEGAASRGADSLPHSSDFPEVQTHHGNNIPPSSRRNRRSV